jgi:hypothetical protein
MGCLLFKNLLMKTKIFFACAGSCWPLQIAAAPSFFLYCFIKTDSVDRGKGVGVGGERRQRQQELQK